MKKSMWTAFVFMAAALIALPILCVRIDSEKENITITEEILEGNPEAARGITLHIGTETDGHLIWNTDYTVGDSGECEVRFDFSHKRYGWMDSSVQLQTAGMEFNAEFLNGYAMGSRDSDAAIGSGNWLLPEVVRAVAGRTLAGEERSETVRLCDYYKVHPVNFSVSDWSNRRGYYSSDSSVFGEFFHIAVEENMMLEMTVKKNDAGDVVFLECNILEEDGGIVSEVSAFGEDGCYYAYNYEDRRTGKSLDRGQNSGIFYIPFHGQENSLLLPIVPEQVKKVCELPEDGIPVQMLLDEERNLLYLVSREETGYFLDIYDLENMEGGEIVMAQRIQVFSVSSPVCLRTTMEEGGILVGWEDGSFSFVAEENEQYRLWCTDKLVDFLQEPEDRTIQAVYLEEQVCSFDGERLVLACFDWSRSSVDVQLTVYKPEGLVYSGIYRHSGSTGKGEAVLQGSVTDSFGFPMRPLELTIAPVK